jgi:hypothetical protein
MRMRMMMMMVVVSIKKTCRSDVVAKVVHGDAVLDDA